MFYQLVEAGTRDKEFAEQYKLMPASHYKYLNQSGCVKIDGISDTKKLDALRLAFNVLQVISRYTQSGFVKGTIYWALIVNANNFVYLKLLRISLFNFPRMENLTFV